MDGHPQQSLNDFQDQIELLRAEMIARIAEVSTTVDEHDALLTDHHQAAESTLRSPASDTADAGQLRYRSVQDWVAGHFSPIYVRPIGGAHRWCAQWWRHPEAIIRLEALWRSWETRRVQPLGMEGWVREQLDHHLPQLMGPQGPFASCTPERHNTDLPDLAVTPAPAGWWQPAPQPREPG